MTKLSVVSSTAKEVVKVKAHADSTTIHDTAINTFANTGHPKTFQNYLSVLVREATHIKASPIFCRRGQTTQPGKINVISSPLNTALILHHFHLMTKILN